MLASNLTVKDLDEMAIAITAVFRGKARAAPEFSSGVPYIRIRGTGIDTLILKDIWAMLSPYIQDGYFLSGMYPLESIKIDRAISRGGLPAPSKDPMYLRVRGLLNIELQDQIG